MGLSLHIGDLLYRLKSNRPCPSTQSGSATSRRAVSPLSAASLPGGESVGLQSV